MDGLSQKPLQVEVNIIETGKSRLCLVLLIFSNGSNLLVLVNVKRPFPVCFPFGKKMAG
jgi:hypothetical protein